MMEPLLRRLHLLLTGICASSLAFGWFEGLYLFFAIPGPAPWNQRDDQIVGSWIDMVGLPFVFLLGMPVVLFAPCCGCCGGAERTPEEANGLASAESGRCARCCQRCCSASFGWLPRAINRRSHAALAAALPLLLLASAVPWPAKTFKGIAVHLAFAVMAVSLRRSGAAGGETFTAAASIASQSVLLLCCIRAAAWSPNILFWSIQHAALVAAPALALQAALHKLTASGESTRIEVTLAPHADERAALAAAAAAVDANNTKTPAPLVEPTHTTAAQPSSGAVASAAIFLSTLGHWVVYIGASPFLLIRGSGDDAVPELATLLPPLLLAVASECVAVWLSAEGDGTTRMCTPGLAASLLSGGNTNSICGRRGAAALFCCLNALGCALFFLTRLGTASLAGGSLLLALLPWWFRLAAVKLRWWASSGSGGGTDTGAGTDDKWARLCLSLAWFTLANIVLLGLLWQSFILVRGLTGLVVLSLLFVADVLEHQQLQQLPLQPSPTIDAAAAAASTAPGVPPSSENGEKSLYLNNLLVFALSAAAALGLLCVTAPLAPVVP
eukprot:COSAG05_NODE_987_length_6284_cov_11.878092_1_plen_555_part_10